MQVKIRSRLIGILITLLLCIVGVILILYTLNDNIVFFYPPSEIHKVPNSITRSRVGGIINDGSIINHRDVTQFVISDKKSSLKVIYRGILPALFRENQGVVAEGYLTTPDLFEAKKLLVKHDENYTPPKLTK